MSDPTGRRANPEAPAAAVPPANSASDPAAEPLVRGQLTSRYQLRRSGADGDQDLFETLLLDFGAINTDAVSGHFHGQLASDLDGHGNATFASIDDRYDDPYVRVYDAYVDLHRVPLTHLVRLGRQRLIDTPEVVYFDGARVESEPWGSAALQFGGYGGVSTHLYESSPAGDVTAGVYAEARPWAGGRARFDWMHLHDDVRFTTHDDDLLGLGWWQSIGTALNGKLGYTALEGRDRDLDARLTWSSPESSSSVQLNYYELLRTQRDLVVEFDPLFTALHELFPYRQYGVHASQAIGTNVDLQLGTDQRHVADRGDVGAFNRDFERYQATIAVHDVAAKGLTCSATMDFWRSNGQLVQTWGADLAQRWSRDLTISAGSYYTLYKFELFLDSERDHVRTWFGRVRWAASAATTVDGSFELEDSDLDRFQVFRLGVTWRF